MNVDLTKEDIITLQQTTRNDVTNTHNNRRKPDGQMKNATEGQKRIMFPAFGVSTNRIRFGNGSNRVTIIAYEIKCHSTKSTLLKAFLIKSSILDLIPPFDSNIHSISHCVIQSTVATTVKNQITQQNYFLAQTGIVPIFTISETTIKSDLKTRLLTFLL